MRRHSPASPYSRLAILLSESPATTVYLFSVSTGRDVGGGAARGAVDDPPLWTFEKSAFRFFSSSSLPKTLSNSPILPPGRWYRGAAGRRDGGSVRTTHTAPGDRGRIAGAGRGARGPGASSA